MYGVIITAESYETRLKRRKGLCLAFNNLLALIHACFQVNVVAALGFTSILIFNPTFNAKRVVRTAHIALGFTGFSLWYSHNYYPFSVLISRLLIQ